MIKSISNYYSKHKAFLHYLFISVFVTVIDVLVSFFAEKSLAAFHQTYSTLIANTLGVVVGFIIQYFLAARLVYNTNDLKAFTKFLLTFFMNLCLANIIVYIFRFWVFNGSEHMIAFSISKFSSIVLPFFFTYFVRKKWIGTGKEVQK
ncbi:MAG: hypothetical protein LBM65_04830 [Oscillospiraceae bacterium]|jgi:putative flippase GtrA|nr:hypothetical protein [Oscillospiraceae bacterium]